MKKFLFIFLLFCLTSCDDGYKKPDDVRKVKKGISVNELKYLMGEPYNVVVQPGCEEWKFHYDGGGRYLNGLVVTITSDKVTDFYSY